LERQYIVFSAAAAGAFAVLILLAFYNPLQASEGDSPDLIKAKKGEETYVRYSPAVIKLIQDLPNKNSVEVEVSSELQVTNFAGLSGQVRYTDMEITYVDDGVVKTINDDDFGSIEYRFRPDTGNKTTYVYENADFLASSQDAQLIVAIEPLSSAKVGDHYTVKLVLHTGGLVSYAIDEKVIEIVS
jgi:hypothetical protein